MLWVIDGPPVINPSTHLNHIQITQCSLPYVMCTRVLTHILTTTSLTLKFQIRPVYLGLIVILNQTTRWWLFDTNTIMPPRTCAAPSLGTPRFFLKTELIDLAFQTRTYLGFIFFTLHHIFFLYLITLLFFLIKLSFY